MTDRMIRVWPKNDDIRRLIRHPTAGALTPKAEGDLWPEDQFTFRRIKDGDVLTSAPRAAVPPSTDSGVTAT